MKALSAIGLDDVRAVYSGIECDLWQLLMGCQIHMGGLKSSTELATRAGIQPGTRGVDLCCCMGAGMRFLLRFRGAAAMTGVDMTAQVLDAGRRRADTEKLADRMQFVQAEATRTGLPSEAFDFAWGEDAWCYVPDKAALIKEAVRLVRSGGTVAFTDWVEGTVPLTDEDARRFMTFMKFPSLASICDYTQYLEQNRCRIVCAEDTGRFAPSIELYLSMVDNQLAYDALAILGFNGPALESIAAEMIFARDLARAGKLAQARIVAVRE